MKKQTEVETFYVQTITTASGEKASLPAERIDPQPVQLADGAFGSDEAKAHAREQLVQKGYKVRSVNFTKARIIAYVEDGESRRKVRSAKSRL